MAWATPQFSEDEIREASRVLIDPEATPGQRSKALVVANNWRLAHGYPLNTFQVNLRHRARKIALDPLIAQRLKRLPSIEKKMRKMPHLHLLRMQDLGGCRAVVSKVEQVDALTELHKHARVKHELQRIDDYIREPRASGYRGIHLRYRHFSDKRPEFNGLRIEVQLRTRVQHAWATAVETVGLFTNQELKSNRGDKAWLRFFAVMSSAIAEFEGTPIVPGMPTSPTQARSELKAFANARNVIGRLEFYRLALHEVEQQGDFRTSRLFLLVLNTSTPSLTIQGFTGRQRNEAAAEYAKVEQETADKPEIDAVLVSVESMAALRTAYPNYFADTTIFVNLLESIIE